MVFWWYFTTQFDPEDEYRAGCRNVSHCQPQSYSDYVLLGDNTQPTYCSSLRREDGRNLKSSLKKSSLAGSVPFKPSIAFNHIGVNLFSNVYKNQYLPFSAFFLVMSYQLKLILKFKTQILNFRSR